MLWDLIRCKLSRMWEDWYKMYISEQQGSTTTSRNISMLHFIPFQSNMVIGNWNVTWYLIQPPFIDEIFADKFEEQGLLTLMLTMDISSKWVFLSLIFGQSLVLFISLVFNAQSMPRELIWYEARASLDWQACLGAHCPSDIVRGEGTRVTVPSGYWWFVFSFRGDLV